MEVKQLIAKIQELSSEQTYALFENLVDHLSDSDFKHLVDVVMSEKEYRNQYEL